MDKHALLKYFASPAVVWDLIFFPKFDWWLVWYDDGYHHNTFYSRSDAHRAASNLDVDFKHVFHRDQIVQCKDYFNVSL